MMMSHCIVHTLVHSHLTESSCFEVVQHLQDLNHEGMHAFVHVSALLSAYMRFKGLLEQCMRSD